MPSVPPGDQTGVYYVVVSNLTWRCSWQKLKDFARNPQPDGTCINIDHAYVYPGTHSTDGWVRVIGKSDFKRALDHLNGGVLEGRALLADGRNETQTLQLRDLAPTIRTSPTPNRQEVTATEYVAPTSSFYQALEVSPTQSSYPGQEIFPEQFYHQQQAMANYPQPPSPAFLSNSSFYSTPPPTYETVTTYTIRPSQDYITPVPTANIVYAGNMAPSTPINVFQVQPVYPCPPPTLTYTTTQMTTPIATPMTTSTMHFPGNTNAMANMSINSAATTSHPNHSNRVVKPEARKVIITKLSPKVQESKLDTLLRRVCSKYKPRTDSEEYSPIHSIDIQRSLEGKPKGHAFVIFDSVGLAKKAIEILNKEKFQGRTLEARLAKEGVEPVGGFPHAHVDTGNQNQYYYPTPLQSQASGSSHVRKSDRERSDRTSSDRHGKKKSEKEKKDSDKDNDSGYSGSADSSRGRSKDKKEQDREIRQPMVVDGSGRSKHSDG